MESKSVVSGGQGWGWVGERGGAEVGVVSQGQRKAPQWWQKCATPVSIPDGALRCGFQDATIAENGVKRLGLGRGVSLYCFLQLSGNPQLSEN